MKPTVVLAGNLAAPSAALYMASAAPVSGTPVMLTGALPDQARRVIVTAGSEAAQRTMKITGTARNGNIISETVTIPATTAGAYQTLQDFASVTQGLPGGGGWTAAATIGTNTVASSAWVQVDRHLTPINIGIGVINLSACNWTVEYT
ncbi:MAG: hypothetical protein ACREQ5_20550, partial [Candidatus Dormibacteria bacterium]